MGLRFPPSGFTDRTAARAGVRYASLLRRFAGAFLDGLLVSMINYIIGAVLSFAPSPFTSKLWPLIELFTFLSVIAITYQTLCLDRLEGQTPGMRVMQIRCVPVVGHGRISFAQALVRSISAAVLIDGIWFLTFWGQSWLVLVTLAAYLWPLVDSRRQTWWDKVARTVVLDERL